MERDYGILFPANENSRYDLVAEASGQFWRIQVKYSSPKNGMLRINCISSNNWSEKVYTSHEIDYIAAYDPTNGSIYFVPVNELNGRQINLRVEGARNHQTKKIKYASEYLFTPR